MERTEVLDDVVEFLDEITILASVLLLDFSLRESLISVSLSHFELVFCNLQIYS